MPVKPAIIPSLRYKDAPAAIDFLCRAFGFERHAVHANSDDAKTIEHAQLVREGQMIMLGSVRADAKAKHMTTVAEAGGNTHGIYVVTDDIDGHAARAKAEGAEILAAPANQSYGGRLYAARDSEGYVWSFGDYDPFATHS